MAHDDMPDFCQRCKTWWLRRLHCPVYRAQLVKKAMPKVMPLLRPGVHAMWDDDERTN